MVASEALTAVVAGETGEGADRVAVGGIEDISFDTALTSSLIGASFTSHWADSTIRCGC